MVIRRTFRKPKSAVLECVVQDLSSSEACIVFQANDVDISPVNCVDGAQSENIQSMTTDFIIPNTYHRKDQTFSCTVHLSPSKKWTSKSTGNIFGRK